jgi:hypothetical protein
VAEPVQDYLAGEVVQRPGPAGDGQPPVAEADATELELADRLGSGGVDGGQRSTSRSAGFRAACTA